MGPQISSRSKKSTNRGNFLKIHGRSPSCTAGTTTKFDALIFATFHCSASVDLTVLTMAAYTDMSPIRSMCYWDASTRTWQRATRNCRMATGLCEWNANAGLWLPAVFPPHPYAAQTPAPALNRPFPGATPWTPPVPSPGARGGNFGLSTARFLGTPPVTPGRAGRTPPTTAGVPIRETILPLVQQQDWGNAAQRRSPH